MVAATQIGDRFHSAQIRLEELAQPNYLGDAGPRLPEREDAARLRLAQEFFFHLVGAADVLAQLINEHRSLGMKPERVSMGGVCALLPADDGLRKALGPLCQKTWDTPVPNDPYSEDGLIFRAFLYRHSVTHRHVSPFVFRIARPESTVHLLIDPRKPGTDSSAQTAEGELKKMLAVMRSRCEAALGAIDAAR